VGKTKTRFAHPTRLWIGAGQRTCKKGFPACPLPTAPGCNALAALRPLFSFTRNDTQLPQWLYAVWHFLKKCPGYQRQMKILFFAKQSLGTRKTIIERCMTLSLMHPTNLIV